VYWLWPKYALPWSSVTTPVGPVSTSRIAVNRHAGLEAQVDLSIVAVLSLIRPYSIEPDWSSTSPMDGVWGVGVKRTAGHAASGPGGATTPSSTQRPSSVQTY